MLKQITITTALFFCLNCLFGQLNNPVWDIGTKWTYELDQENFNQIIKSIELEIVDTTTINNLKLYVVESEPEYPGTKYFYYDDGRVFNYNQEYNILELLYVFDSNTNYHTEYRPICDPNFPQDSLISKQYTILIDSIVDFEMPDGTYQKLQHVSSWDTIFEGLDTIAFSESSRSVLEGIGFIQGNGDFTHNWGIGMYVCDNWGSYIGRLRCVETDSIFYNFVGYPCDSTWTITSTDQIKDRTKITIFPNPTTEVFTISGIDSDLKYEIYSSSGRLLQKGKTQNKRVYLKEAGFNIIRLFLNGTWIYQRIFKLTN